MTSNLNQKLSVLKNALLAVGTDVYHYKRPQGKNRFVVWQEDGEGESFHGDNHKKEQVIHGSVDLFTKTEFDPWTDAIQECLDEAAVAWALDSVIYEDDTGFIHYEWFFEV